jgi:hypothetical protein
VLPFHCTVEVEMKLVPLTVSLNAAAPAVTAAGASKATDGIGFSASSLPPQQDGVLAARARVTMSVHGRQYCRDVTATGAIDPIA